MPWVRPIAYCEIERYCQGVLLSRIADGQLFKAPIWDDIRTLEGTQFRGRVDIIYGGFPCQDISIAGRGGGLEGKRSGLFFEILRLAKEIKPTFLFLENVPAIRTRGLETVVRELADLGYDCRWDHLSAHDVGAPHKRDRWFLLAHAERHDLRDHQQRVPGRLSGDISDERQAVTEDNGQKSVVADSEGDGRREGRAKSAGKQGRSGIAGGGYAMGNANVTRLEIRKSRKPGEQPAALGTGWWESEPRVGRVVNGHPARVDRVKALGNGVVPAQAREAFMKMMGLCASST